jgi:hypothetical protein
VRGFVCRAIISLAILFMIRVYGSKASEREVLAVLSEFRAGTLVGRVPDAGHY